MLQADGEGGRGSTSEPPGSVRRPAGLVGPGAETAPDRAVREAASEYQLRVLSAIVVGGGVSLSPLGERFVVANFLGSVRAVDASDGLDVCVTRVIADL